MPVYAAAADATEAILVGYVYAEDHEVAPSASEPRSSHKRSFDAHASFLSWAAGSGPRDVVVGVSLAKERLNLLKILRDISPEEVCRLRLPASVRDTFPAEVLSHVETPLDTMATLAHLMEDHFDIGKHYRRQWMILEDERNYKRLSSGHRATVRTDQAVPVWGSIFPDNVAVVSRSAARDSEPNEFSSVKRSIFSRSKLVVVAGKPISVPENVDTVKFGLHIASQDLAENAHAASTAAKKRAALADPPSATAIRPVKTLLFVITYFANGPRAYTVDQITWAIGNASRYYAVSAYGRLVTFDVTIRTVDLSLNNTGYPSHTEIENEARTKLTGDNWNNFDHWYDTLLMSWMNYAH